MYTDCLRIAIPVSVDERNLFQCKYNNKYGRKVPLRDAVHNFFTSPAWEDTKEQFKNLYRHYQFHGWKDLWNEIVTVLDPIGEGKAYKVKMLTLAFLI